MLLYAMLGCVKPSPALETGARIDSGETGTIDTGEASLCGAWSGVRAEGTAWALAPTEAYIAQWGWTGAGTSTVTSVSSELVTVELVAHYEGSEGYFDLRRADTWRCDGAAAWWVRSDVRSDGESGGTHIGSAAVRTFEPGWLVRPATAEVGASWADNFTVTTTFEGGEPSSGAASCVSTVAEEAVRAVEAGDVLARHVSVECTGVGVDSVWLREFGGFVEDDDLQLVAYRP